MKAIKMTEDRVQYLIREAKAGDRLAFGELIETYRVRLEALIQSRLGSALKNVLDVEDIFQETLYRAFLSVGGFEWRKEDSFFSWLGAIAENVIRAAAKKAEKGDIIQLEREPADSRASPSRALRRDERFNRLESSFKHLSPDHQEVIYLARIEGLAIKEIADRMNRSPDAVKQLLMRALRSLKARFGETESLRLPARRLKGEGEHGE